MLSKDMAQRIDQIVEDFHILYYDDFERTWEQTYWWGTKILKCPLDLWIYQEIMHHQQPDVVLETGTAHGGSALWFAHMFDIMGRGEVITIDIEGPSIFPERPQHDRITYVTGSSIDHEVVTEVKELINGRDTLVVLDSAHDAGHVKRELDIWSDVVDPGGYLIVEDTNVHGHPVCPEHPAGPMEAVEQFLSKRDDFVIERDREKFHLTFNPKGYLRRLQLLR